MAQGLRLAAVGEIVEDVYLPADERRLGGISANFARGAADEGAEAHLYAAVGDDDRGRRLAAALAGTPVRAHLKTLAGPSAEQKIRIAEGGERVFCGFETGVLADYRLGAAELAELGRMDVLALTCSKELGHVFRQCLPLAPARVADFSQESPDGDPERPETWIAPWLDALAIAFVGGRAAWAPRLAEASRGHAAVVVLTAGAAGAYAFAGGVTHHQPSLATRVVDTTGCGDAFQSAFTVARFRGASIGDALAAGARRAAAVAARLGT